jgi:hypothetical protein
MEHAQENGKLKRYQLKLEFSVRGSANRPDLPSAPSTKSTRAVNVSVALMSKMRCKRTEHVEFLQFKNITNVKIKEVGLEKSSNCSRTIVFRIHNNVS